MPGRILRTTSGWKAQLEAAERLARARALPAGILDQLYTAQRPAASGGVWERAAAVQALDAALATGDAARIGPALVTAFQRMEQAGLRDSFAAIAAPGCSPRSCRAMPPIWRCGCGSGPERPRSRAHPKTSSTPRFWRWRPAASPEPLTPALGALAPVFAAELPPQPDPKDGIALAPALYGALADADAGTQGDITRAVRGVRMLRELGLIADARRVATQIAIDPLLKVALAMTALKQRIATFLDAQAAEAGAARNTILSYGRDLADFADWLAAEGLISTASAATRSSAICPIAKRRAGALDPGAAPLGDPPADPLSRWRKAGARTTRDPHPGARARPNACPRC